MNKYLGDLMVSQIADTIAEIVFELPTLVTTKLADMERKMDLLVAAAALSQAKAMATVRVASEHVGVSVGTMRRWIKTGRVKAVKFDNTVRIDLAQFHGTDDEDITALAWKARLKASGSI